MILGLKYTHIHHVLTIHHIDLTRLFSGLIEDVSQMALSTVLTIVHGSHENTSTALNLD